MPDTQKITICAQIHYGQDEYKRSLRKIVPLPALMDVIDRGGASVVFTKGVFDLLHKGHMHLITYCRHLANQMPSSLVVVGIASDRAVSLRKGPERPINGLSERMAQIAALSDVDYVVSFDEEYPVELLRLLQPAVYVKGADTTGLDLPEGSAKECTVTDSVTNPELGYLVKSGGRLVVFVNHGGASSSSLINKILRKSERSQP